MESQLLEEYLRLLHGSELSAAQFSRLLTRFESLDRIRDFVSSEPLGRGLSSPQVAAILAPEKSRNVDNCIKNDLNWLENDANSIVCYEDKAYPELLRQTGGAPALLYVRGNPHQLSGPLLAMVGSRKSSSYGSRNAYWLAHELGRIGLGICSGLAKGIDAQAHAGALAANAGTVAVMGTGADLIYPHTNRPLAERILENGALITEFPLGTPPLPAHFPQRNRIISGLCCGALVVEAALRSGSLITARLAMEQNREVFALPGTINNPLSRGCHQLIKQGAKLVETPEDVLEELITPGLLNTLDVAVECGESKQPTGQQTGSTKEQRLILKELQAESCLVDTLTERTGLELQQLSNELVQLEIQGLIDSTGGRYSRAY